MSRRASNDMFAIKKDGTYIALTTNITISFSNATLPLAAQNIYGTISNYHNSEISLMYISDDITQSEMTDLRTAVNTFQTTLSRQV
jgi:purine-nucleoside phosphorylase